MQVLWGILDLEQPDTQTINNIVIPSVELIYSYAECLALHGNDVGHHSVAPAVALLKKLLFAPYEAVQTSSRSLSFLHFGSLHTTLSLFCHAILTYILSQLGNIFKVASGPLSETDHVGY